MASHLLRLEHVMLVEAAHFTDVAHTVCKGIAHPIIHGGFANIDYAGIRHRLYLRGDYRSSKFRTTRGPVGVIVQVERSKIGVILLRCPKRRVKIHRIQPELCQRIKNRLTMRGKRLIARTARQTFRINARLARSHNHKEFHAFRLKLVTELKDCLNRVIKLCTAHIQRRRLHQEFNILPVKQPTTFARAQHHLFARFVKKVPHGQLILGSKLQHQHILVFHLFFEGAQVATCPHTVILDTPEGAPQRKMSEFGHNRLKRGVHRLEVFGLIFQGRKQGISPFQQLVVSFGRVQLRIAVHRKHHRFQVRKSPDHRFQGFAHLATSRHGFTGGKPGFIQLGGSSRHPGFANKGSIEHILEDIKAYKAFFATNIRKCLRRKREQQQNRKNNNKGYIKFFHTSKITNST